MSNIRTLTKHGTTIEARMVGPDRVPVRYIGKYKCDWIKETYDLSTLFAADWVDETEMIEADLAVCKRVSRGEITVDEAKAIQSEGAAE